MYSFLSSGTSSIKDYVDLTCIPYTKRT